MKARMNTRSRIQSMVFAFLLAISLMLAAPPWAAYAGTIYRVVPSGGMTSGSCGDTWANGCDLQYALNTIATAGDELWVKRGTYTPIAGSDRTISFNLNNGVVIYGGFAGTEASLSERNWLVNLTILSGDIGSPGVTSDNSYHVVNATSAVTASAILDGFTISAGNANGPIPANFGGGMFNDHASPTLNNIVFSDNHAGARGGGMYNNASHSALTNVTFQNNTAGSNGGGMNENNSWMTLSFVTFHANTAGHFGGGMADEESSTSRLNNVTFTDNHSDFGGGMGIDTNYPGYLPSLTNVTFTGNSASSRGGGVYLYTSSPTLTNVVFSANSAAASGGGMGSYASHPTLTNVTFSNNTAPANAGGAIYNFGPTGPTGSTALIQNSLLWGDTGGEVVNDAASASTSTIAYSLVQGCKTGGAWNPACGTDNGHNLADANPDFETDLHLKVTSPVIDNGNNAYLNGLVNDLDGHPRVVGGVVDLGAYEYQHGAMIYRVIPSGGRTSGSCGDTWDNGCDLQYALATKAAAGDELWVKMGTYKPTSMFDRAASFILKSSVALYGGFDGTEILLGQRNWEANPTILSGDLNGDDLFNFTNYSDNSYHVVIASGLDVAAILDGVTIRGGNANGADSHKNYGGGVFMLTGNPSLTNLAITDNYAAYLGGGMYANAAGTLKNTTFVGNSAQYGGGMASGSYIIMTGVVFFDNTASQDGGGLYISGYPLVYNSLIYSNTASRGAGVFNTGGAVLINATLWGNSATSSGSGIYSTNGSQPHILNSILWGDSEGGHPGGEIRNDSTGGPSIPLITYSLIYSCNPSGIWNAACGTDGGHNRTDADPQFLDSAHGNLRLQDTSPAINQGNNAFLSSVPTDLDGNPRIVDGTADLGAYEHQFNNTPPVVFPFTEGGMQGQDILFSANNYTSHFSDDDGDSLASIRITSLPDQGALYLGTTAVTPNQEISAAALGDIRFTPPTSWCGTTSFNWNGSDGVVYADDEATVTLTVTPIWSNVYLPSIIR